MSSKHTYHHSLWAVLAALALLILAGGAVAENVAAYRDFVPVQDGRTDQVQKIATYHPERILIKLTSQAFEDADLHFSMEKGAVAPSTRTGISSLDALCTRAGVMRISRPFIQVTNRKKANELGLERWYMLETDGATDVLAMAERFRDDRAIEAASVDWRAFPAVAPSDPLYADSWGHNNTAQLPDLDWGGTYEHDLSTTVGTVGFDANAEAAWDESQGFGSSSVVVAIIDSGVDSSHPDLVQVTGYDFGDSDSDPNDNSSSSGHGTCCAGVAAATANNGIGACGSAPNSSIMPLKVADSSGSMYFSYIANALYYAADNGADVISISLGASVSSDSATDTAIAYAYNAGCTILAATGNENDSTISYPAINTYVIGVGAASPCGERKRSSSSTSEVNSGVSTDPNGYTCDGERWWGSNYGVNTQDAAGAVDVIAPTILPTTDRQGSNGYDTDDYYDFFNGTSCATPYAAGVCALIKAANPSYTPAQVRDKLTSTAQDVTSVESGSGWDRYAGYGMVDAAAAVDGGGSTGSAPVAAFSGSPTSGDYPLTVSFTDGSSNSPTSWSWDFGDGGSSSSQNPSHTYTAAGTYTVELTATNSYGSDTETQSGYITVTEPSTGGDYASLPYSTGFESGSLDSYWETYSDNNGRVQITTSNTPYAGSYHMTMDCSSNGTYSTNEAWLRLDLSGQDQVDLSFYWKDFSDETHSADGVFFSDDGGSSFTQVLAFSPGSYTNNSWSLKELDVTALAASNGLSLNSTFVVKFQQYDNYTMTTDGMAFDAIEVVGSVTEPDALTLTAPNGGETLTGGGTSEITWTSTGSISTVDLSYSTDGGSNWTTIVSGTTNDGAHTWTVPSVATTTGLVRVAGNSVSDTSDAVFTIEYVAPTVTLTAPNGGETLTGGDSTYITWTSTGSISTVDLSYSTDGGSNWTAIVTGTANDGTQAWTVPSVATTQGLVRVVGGGSTDTSDAVFTIEYVAPTVTLTAPNGGETLTGGGTTEITWTSTGSIAAVDLEYSTDNGSNWSDIVADTDNDGAYTWTVPTTATTQGLVRVTGDSATDVSDAVFTIEYTVTGDYAVVPYSTGFESGDFDAYWTTTSTNNGRVRILSTNTPYAGSYHMTMDCSSNGTYSTNQADLAMDLSGETEVELNFYWKEFGDETHTADGVYFSDDDGDSFTKVQALNGASYTNNTWQAFSLDVDALASANGLDLTSTFIIRFQQYDNYMMTTDGFAFDAIEVVEGSTGGGGGDTGITAETEDNGSIANANGPVGDGTAVSGTLSSSTDDDYFWFDVDTAGTITISVAISGSADLDWYLYNSSGTQVDRGYTVSNPETGSYSASVGTYYVRVDGYRGATASYTLTVTGGLSAVDEAPEKQDTPLVFNLAQNTPNPFNPMTKIAFDLPQTSRVMLRIYDTRGHLVRTLVDETLSAGHMERTWDGRDDTGAQVHSGVYYYAIEAKDFRATRKMTLLK